MTVYHGKSSCFSVQNSTRATRWKFHEIIVENAHSQTNSLPLPSSVPTSLLSLSFIRRFQLKDSYMLLFTFAMSRVSLESGRGFIRYSFDSCLRPFTRNAALHDAQRRDECKKSTSIKEITNEIRL